MSALSAATTTHGAARGHSRPRYYPMLRDMPDVVVFSCNSPASFSSNSYHVTVWARVDRRRRRSRDEYSGRGRWAQPGYKHCRRLGAARRVCYSMCTHASNSAGCANLLRPEGHTRRRRAVYGRLCAWNCPGESYRPVAVPLTSCRWPSALRVLLVGRVITACESGRAGRIFA